MNFSLKLIFFCVCFLSSFDILDLSYGQLGNHVSISFYRPHNGLINCWTQFSQTVTWAADSRKYMKRFFPLQVHINKNVHSFLCVVWVVRCCFSLFSHKVCSSVFWKSSVQHWKFFYMSNSDFCALGIIPFQKKDRKKLALEAL